MDTKKFVFYGLIRPPSPSLFSLFFLFRHDPKLYTPSTMYKHYINTICCRCLAYFDQKKYTFKPKYSFLISVLINFLWNCCKAQKIKFYICFVPEKENNFTSCKIDGPICPKTSKLQDFCLFLIVLLGIYNFEHDPISVNWYREPLIFF